MSISVPYTNVSAAFPLDFVAHNSGRITTSVWDFGDGTIVSNRVYITHVWSQPGNYSVRLTGYNDSNPAGVSVMVLIKVATQPVFYVNASNTTPLYPYTNWAGAAQTIQDAIDAGTSAGFLVLVTNGVYSSGGRAVYGSMTNRITLNSGIQVRSVNGPGVTTIVGQGASGSTNNGDGAIRCAYLGMNAILSGFTLTNGHTLGGFWDYYKGLSGGGVWSEAGGLVTNCVLTGNSATRLGGGAFSAVLTNCTLTGNFAETGAGAAKSVLANCNLSGNWATLAGGGVDGGSQTACTFSGNYAGSGGAAAESTMVNCSLWGNYATNGGGASGCILTNCSLLTNRAALGGGVYAGVVFGCTFWRNYATNNGGGSHSATLANCLLSSNSAGVYGGGWYSGSLSNCAFIGNRATNYGGGSYEGTLNYCTFTNNNSTTSGGGSAGGFLSNCTLSANFAPSQGGGSAGGTLNYCTVTGNSTTNIGGGSYGGTFNYCTISDNSAYEGGGCYGSTLNNCTLARNSAVAGGGGLSEGVAKNCVLTGNSAFLGGGSRDCTLTNCTSTGNLANTGGGSYMDHLYNCIVYYNTAYQNPNTLSVLQFSCTTPPLFGTNNIDNDPLLASDSHLSAASPCIGRGSASYASGVDIDGEPWQNPPCMGADQYVAGAITGPLAMSIWAAYTNVSAHFPIAFVAQNAGRINLSVWDFGDGTILTNQASLSHAWSEPGNYVVRLTGYNDEHPGGVSTAIAVAVATQSIHFVNASNPAPAYPYTNWATAARTIQEAIESGNPRGCLILVTNGFYNTGGKALVGLVTNRIVVNPGIEVRSVSGPGVTWIVGQGAAGSGTNGDGAIRCAYVGMNAVLDGFTLTNGHTRAAGDADAEQSGGGVWCEVSGMVTNCVITGNSASYGGGSRWGILDCCILVSNTTIWPSGYGGGGGGSYGSALNNCALAGNRALLGSGGASYLCKLNSCALSNNYALNGGGSYRSTLNSCTLTGNYSSDYGGASYRDTLTNCVLNGNSSWFGGGSGESTLRNCVLAGNLGADGGGSYLGSLENCTITGNSGNYGGGSYGGVLNNCIIYFNNHSSVEDWFSGTLNYCCTTPMPTNGTGNITDAPLFVNTAVGDYRLQPTSPCIDTGVNQSWMFQSADFAGNSRVINGKVDMGAYETPFTLNLRVWLQGPYAINAHAMRAANPTNIPFTSPYSDDPRTLTNLPGNVVDWVLVQLRRTNGTIAVANSLFVNTQGQILGVDGSTGMTAEVPAGGYSLVVKHRNHLSAMSAQLVAFTNYSVSYDFSTGADKYYGGSNATVQLEPGVWGMIAGDADGDGMIGAADRSIYTNQLGRAGYDRADFDLDGIVSTNDLAFFTANRDRSTGATNGDTPLLPSLNITPIRRTVLAGATVTLTASGATNPVNWAFATNASGGALVPTGSNTALYAAGSGSNVVDIVEAWEGNKLGRAWVNVISAADVTRVGKAIIMSARRSDDDGVWPTTHYLGNLAYNTLLYRGFAKNNIQYLSPMSNEDVDGNGALDDVAMVSTFSNAAMTFTNWAMTNPNRLFVYLVDHGGDFSGAGYFRINPSEVLTATTLNQWLNTVQNTYGIEVVLVLDFCEAGSFLEPLKYTGQGRRTVIAACRTNEPTYYLAGGQVSFSDAFFGGLLTGLDVAQSFGLARDAMSVYQSSWMDANGDGLYTAGVDPGLMNGTYIGASFIEGKDVPQIGHVMGDQALTGTTEATLWAYDIASSYTLSRVWCVVVPPSHNPNPTNPVADLPLLDLTYNPDTDRFEAQYSGFSEQGTYKLIYYAQDIWDSVSLPRQSYLFQNGFQERVILVTGGNTNTVIWPGVDNTARQAYNTFRSRRLDAMAIRYLSPVAFEDIDADGTNDVAGSSSIANLSYAITNWATGANRLTVYLLGDGSSSAFRLNPVETLTAADLKNWLDIYQTSNGEAQVVMDFAGSSAFIPALRASPNLLRICVASSTNQTCLFTNGGLVSFSDFFLHGVLNGDSIGQAFADARNAIRTASGIRLNQTAQLDDNGDGVGDKYDGSKAKTRYIGSAFRTGADAPVIGSVMSNSTVVVGEPLLVWAKDVSAVAGISNALCVITPPDYLGQSDLPQINLTWNPANSRYETVYTNFILPGSYGFTFFATDTSGQLSTPLQTTVTSIYTNLSPLAVCAVITPDGSFKVTYEGYAGKSYAIEESTNFLNWTSLLTNEVPDDGMLYFSISPTNGRAFYRTRLIQ
jgi:hypothetical protein